MSEDPILITNLNDFIFCPASIYFHNLDDKIDKVISQDSFQLNGSAAHEKTDNAVYSTKRSILQSISVYSSEYNLIGKIDTFDIEKGILTERKKKIKTIYDGYIFQLYAQYFCLIEMGFTVNEVRLYSMDDNKVYRIPVPYEDNEMFLKFKKVVNDMNLFNIDFFRQDNQSKCLNCIYEPICCYSLL